MVRIRRVKDILITRFTKLRMFDLHCFGLEIDSIGMALL